ncbi:MAG: Smr/MutS family protein [Sphingobacteriales bacterium]|nr:Smr/MutS family protein [Sphingobacteriales bacterium]
MKFQTGDKVLLIHSKEEGEVVEIINKQMVMVDVDGVQFPAYIDQLEFPYFKRFSQKKTEPKKQKIYVDEIKKEKATAGYKVGDGVWLSFLPVFDKDVFDEDIVDYFKLFLVNQTEDHFIFDYTLTLTATVDFELQNEIAPLQDFYLHDVSLEKFNDNPRFDFEFSLKIPDRKRTDYFETVFKPKAKQIFNKIEEVLQKQEATFSYHLFEKYPDKIKEEKMSLDKLTRAGFKVYDAEKFRNHLEPVRTVVDLHIEKLTDNWKHLSNFEKLTLQLKTFEKYYDLALQHYQPMLIVIHGVGTGKLKEEIHGILKHKKEVKSFVNQFHPSFGYGATEIYFQY